MWNSSITLPMYWHGSAYLVSDIASLLQHAGQLAEQLQRYQSDNDQGTSGRRMRRSWQCIWDQECSDWEQSLAHCHGSWFQQYSNRVVQCQPMQRYAVTSQYKKTLVKLSCETKVRCLLERLKEADRSPCWCATLKRNQILPMQDSCLSWQQKSVDCKFQWYVQWKDWVPWVQLQFVFR